MYRTGSWTAFYGGMAVGIGSGAHLGNAARGNALASIGGCLAVLGVWALATDLRSPPPDVALLLSFSMIAGALWGEMATTPPRAALPGQPLPDSSAGR
jgi:hypothetical protein